MEEAILNIQINKKGIQFFLDNNERIVIIRPYVSDVDLKVACLSFVPIPKFDNSNTVKFKDEWYGYMTGQSIEEKKKIVMQDMQSVNIGNTYICKDIGFEGTESNSPQNNYGFSNQKTNGAITFGLAQNIIVNDGNEDKGIVCANRTPRNQTTYFQPSSVLWIMPAKGILTDMVVPSNILKPNEVIRAKSVNPIITMGTYLEVDLKDTDTIHFNNDTNLFEKGALP